jgi:hypothetical protein
MTFITNNLLFTYVAKNGLHIMQLKNNKGNNYYEWESNKGSIVEADNPWSLVLLVIAKYLVFDHIYFVSYLIYLL